MGVIRFHWRCLHKKCRRNWNENTLATCSFGWPFAFWDNLSVLYSTMLAWKTKTFFKECIWILTNPPSGSWVKLYSQLAPPSRVGTTCKVSTGVKVCISSPAHTYLSLKPILSVQVPYLKPRKPAIPVRNPLHYVKLGTCTLFTIDPIYNRSLGHKLIGTHGFDRSARRDSADNTWFIT